jgi:hypothetical protein
MINILIINQLLVFSSTLSLLSYYYISYGYVSFPIIQALTNRLSGCLYGTSNQSRCQRYSRLGSNVSRMMIILSRRKPQLTLLLSTATFSIIKTLKIHWLVSWDPTWFGASLARWNILELVSCLLFTTRNLLADRIRMSGSLQPVSLPCDHCSNLSTEQQETSTPGRVTDESTTPMET